MRCVVLAADGDEVVATDVAESGAAVGDARRAAWAALPALVEADEAAGDVRWVWHDTAWWAPRLLRADVRVARAWDLRLCRVILRSAPGAESSGTAKAAPDAWDRLPAAQLDEGALFDDTPDPTELDPVAEHARQLAAVAESPDAVRLRLLLTAESVGALIAAEMTHAGLPWREDEHDRLLTELLGARPASGMRPAVLEALTARLREAFDDPGINPDSPVELVRSLRRAGLQVQSTSKWELQRIEHPGIPILLEYKKLARLLSANGWHWLDTWVRDGRFRPVYVPGGVVTGRWASNGGGALQLPAQVRGAVVADPGWKFVVADAAQLEPRVLAGLARDAKLADAARGADLYAGMVAAGAVETREQAKYGVLGAMYGGTRGESGRMLPRIAKAYPRAIALVEQAARDGEAGKRVRTLLGRGSPVPGQQLRAGQALAASDDATEREMQRAVSDMRAWGRFTRNFVVQGTAAEWALTWMGVLRSRLWALGAGTPLERPHLVFFLHDEVIVHTPEHLADAVAEIVRAAAAEAGRILFRGFALDFPLDVTVVDRYSDAA